jgi:hypothetical protein
MRMAVLAYVAAGLLGVGLHGVAADLSAGAVEGARRSGSVFGYLWDARGEPIADATVRLRNVVSGTVEASALTAANGAFRFESVETGTYLVEYVDEHGRLVAVGHVFSAAPGDTVATFIRLTTRPGGLGALFGRTTSIAAIAISSAAGLGLTALVPPGRDVTPER